MRSSYHIFVSNWLSIFFFFCMVRCCESGLYAITPLLFSHPLQVFDLVIKRFRRCCSECFTFIKQLSYDMKIYFVSWIGDEVRSLAW